MIALSAFGISDGNKNLCSLLKHSKRTHWNTDVSPSFPRHLSCFLKADQIYSSGDIVCFSRLCKAWYVLALTDIVVVFFAEYIKSHLNSNQGFIIPWTNVSIVGPVFLKTSSFNSKTDKASKLTRDLISVGKAYLWKNFLWIKLHRLQICL